MSGPANIQYLTHNQVDKQKWDQCIEQAGNGLIYAYSFYLDTMSQHWDALVMDDYEMVMPLTWNKKYGIKYLYQPFLAAQLGMFGNNITWDHVDLFIKAIPSSFRFAEISLNSKNAGSQLPGTVIERANYIADLNKPYETLYSNYGENARRNIKKSVQLGCSIQKDLAVERVIELAVKQMRSQGQEEKDNIERFTKLYHYLRSREMAITYGVYLQKELLASCVFFFSHNRAYYILVGNHPEGKNTGASHALIDAFIKDHAEKNYVLDFEGSDIPSLARFYSSFGAMAETYPALKINRLPFFLKWMKR